MRKLILGIAVVICLDLAFILAMMGDVQSYEIAKAIESPLFNPIGTRLETSPITALDTDSLAVDTGEYDADARRPMRRIETVRTIGGRKKPSEEMNSYTPAPTFSDTIIWIKKPTIISAPAPTGEKQAEMPAQPVLEKAVAAKSEPVEKKKKKSFFAKTLPVMKKPYDWLKALATKLD